MNKSKKAMPEKQSLDRGNPRNGQTPDGPPCDPEPMHVGLLTRAQVAEKLHCCTHTVQRLTRRGVLPALVFNKRMIRYERGSLERFINSALVK